MFLEQTIDFMSNKTTEFLYSLNENMEIDLNFLFFVIYFSLFILDFLKNALYYEKLSLKMEDIFEQKNQSLLSKLSEVTLQNSNLINLRRNDKRKIKHLRKDIKDLKTYIEEYDQYINNTYY